VHWGRPPHAGHPSSAMRALLPPPGSAPGVRAELDQASAVAHLEEVVAAASIPSIGASPIFPARCPPLLLLAHHPSSRPFVTSGHNHGHLPEHLQVRPSERGPTELKRPTHRAWPRSFTPADGRRRLWAWRARRGGPAVAGRGQAEEGEARHHRAAKEAVRGRQPYLLPFFN
jgi:hypothetical protein